MILRAGLLVLAGAIAATVVVVGHDGSSFRAPRVTQGNSLSVLDARTNTVVGRIRTGLRPISIASGAGSLWIANFGDRTVSRLDLRTRRVVSTFSVSGTPVDLVVGEGAVWVANAFEGTISRIDPETGEVVRSIPVGRAPRGVAVGAGSVWVANHVDGTVSRIDAVTNEVVRTIAVGAGPTSIAVGAGGVWVANSLDRTVSRINPRTGALVARHIALRFHPYALTAGQGAVWVTGPAADAVARIDPAHNRVAATIPAGDGPTAIRAGHGALFVADSSGGTISRIDTRRSAVVRRIPIGGSPEGLALDGSVLWVSSSGPRREAPQKAAAVGTRGGTLRLAAIHPAIGRLDPQKEFISRSWAFELFRCCLLRTLLSYSGRPTNMGGAVLRPDLAVGAPRVSPDGRTWTFRLKSRLRYGPPFEDKTIMSRDIIRALERTAKVGGLAYYFSVIEGFDNFRRGTADSISGLEAPDDRTLVVHLRKPSGDLGARFALATTAPIPPGASDGVHDYGRFLVASGPYMFEGSEALDFHAGKSRRPVSGHMAGRRVVLVRNPSWRPASDSLRPAYVDRIVISIGGRLRDAERKIDAGLLDAVLDFNSSHEQTAAYRADPSRRKLVFSNAGDIMTFMSMNLAIPPLDDIHVRKAVSLVVDKHALRELILAGGSRVIGPLSGDYAGHIVLDSLEDNLLLAYDPYATPGHRGSLPLAQAEMARSRYDRNGDGLCDARNCRRLRAVTSSAASGLRLLRVIQRNLASIGIHFAIVEKLNDTKMFRTLADPTAKVAMGLASGWAKDFPNASSFLPPLFSRSSLGGPSPLPLVPPNASLVGARPQQLRRWGYRVTSVPDLEAKIDQCLPIVGAAQAQCWAEADQFLMEKVVPVVPVMFLDAVRTVSTRVANYSFAQSTAFPALDRIALRQP